MKRIKYWLSSKRRQMAKLHDLKRQLQEAWDEIDALSQGNTAYGKEVASTRDQLHRVARERDKERELRLEAEAALAEEKNRMIIAWRENAEYMEQLANEEE